MKNLRRIEFVYFAVLFFALVAVFGLNIFSGSVITSPHDLAEGLASPPASPQDWSIQDWSTVKYRALFRMIVQGTWSALFAPNDAEHFYATFVVWSFIFFYGAAVALYFFLRELEFDRPTSFIGCLLFLASPPVLLAYKYPIYTREDPLAFFLVALGMIAVVRSHWVGVALISIAAALTRETTLIMPLAFVLAPKQPWLKRIVVAVVPVIALIGIRLAWGNTIPDSLNSSALNFSTPGETLAFLFCVFGVLWMPYLSNLIERWRCADYPNYAWQVLGTSGPIVLALVLIATLTISRAREIRITFILFVWAIPFALGWFRKNSEYVHTLIASRRYWIWAFSILAALSALVLFLHLTNPQLMVYYLADFKNGYWLVVGTLALSITLALFLPKLQRSKLNSAQLK